MRNTHLGILSTEHSLWLSLMVYVKKMSTRKAALSYAVLTWQTEWPSWLGKNLVFRGAQRGLSMRLAQCTTAPSYGPVGGQQRAVGLGGRRRAVRSLAGAEVEGTRLPPAPMASTARASSGSETFGRLADENQIHSLCSCLHRAAVTDKKPWSSCLR